MVYLMLSVRKSVQQESNYYFRKKSNIPEFYL